MGDSRQEGFFPLAAGERLVLAILVGFSGLCFAPLGRHVEIAGVALFGWLMAALMVLSPVLTLALFGRSARRR